MLRFSNLSFISAVGIIFALSSCNQEFITPQASLTGSKWALKAYVNSQTGELQSFRSGSSAELSFNNDASFELRSSDITLYGPFDASQIKESHINLTPTYQKSVSESSAPIQQTIANATNFERVGNTLKIIDMKLKRFLIFERTQ